jgi:hypothetical protein
MAKNPDELNVSEGFVAVPTSSKTIVAKVRDVLAQEHDLPLRMFRQRVEEGEFGGLGHRPYEIFREGDPNIDRARTSGFIMYPIKGGRVYERDIRLV